VLRDLLEADLPHLRPDLLAAHKAKVLHETPSQLLQVLPDPVQHLLVPNAAVAIAASGPEVVRDPPAKALEDEDGEPALAGPQLPADGVQGRVDQISQTGRGALPAEEDEPVNGLSGSWSSVSGLGGRVPRNPQHELQVGLRAAPDPESGPARGLFQGGQHGSAGVLDLLDARLGGAVVPGAPQETFGVLAPAGEAGALLEGGVLEVNARGEHVEDDRVRAEQLKVLLYVLELQVAGPVNHRTGSGAVHGSVREAPPRVAFARQGVQVPVVLEPGPPRLVPVPASPVDAVQKLREQQTASGLSGRRPCGLLEGGNGPRSRVNELFGELEEVSPVGARLGAYNASHPSSNKKFPDSHRTREADEVSAGVEGGEVLDLSGKVEHLENHRVVHVFVYSGVYLNGGDWSHYVQSASNPEPEYLAGVLV
ncbi:hypothetical protein HWI79_1606, partial [Cryptosporidium felis]